MDYYYWLLLLLYEIKKTTLFENPLFVLIILIIHSIISENMFCIKASVIIISVGFEEARPKVTFINSVKTYYRLCGFFRSNAFHQTFWIRFEHSFVEWTYSAIFWSCLVSMSNVVGFSPALVKKFDVKRNYLFIRNCQSAVKYLFFNMKLKYTIIIELIKTYNIHSKKI